MGYSQFGVAIYDHACPRSMSCFDKHLELFSFVILPCVPSEKSDHPTIYPGYGCSLHRMLKLEITLLPKSVFQKYRWLISPTKLCWWSNAPPIISWSWPKISFPVPGTVPWIVRLPVSLQSPSMNNLTTPSSSAHVPHKWCHALSSKFPVWPCL